ncbi:MAG: ABC transporter permease subunit [Spirochaetaceae bacterium]|nr:ABC transporter permease subunit [Spirochaetaceae bacterium]
MASVPTYQQSIAKPRAQTPSRKRAQWIREVYRHRSLLLLLIPGTAYLIVFHYLPLYGMTLAFKEFDVYKGILGSPWADPLLEHFNKLFLAPDAFVRTVRNTIRIALLTTLFGFPAPIILAILLNELHSQRYKRTIQTILYFPHFLSWPFLGALVIEFMSPGSGVMGTLYRAAGLDPPYFMIDPQSWLAVFVISGIWKEVGFSTIVYLASIASIDQELYEAAYIDGSGRTSMAWHITLPSMVPVITILFIFRMGGLITVNFEQVFNLQNLQVRDVADVIDTYIYRLAFEGFQYEFSTALTMLRLGVSMILVWGTNAIVRRYSDYALW